MPFQKINYVDNVTAISAENMNDMQDAILNAEADAAAAQRAAQTAAAQTAAAQTAAQNAAANSAAAQTAAGNAQTATENANTAAENAQTAAQNANETAESIANAAENGEFNGKDGYTPVKYVDYYWTDADLELIVQEVIAALGLPVFGQVNENNTITLKGDLAPGVYTIVYESADGENIIIGTVDTRESYENAFAANTCLINKRTNSSGNIADNVGTFLTDYIDLGDAMANGGTNVLHYKGLYFNTSNWTSTYEIYSYIAYFDKDKKIITNENHRTIADVLTADGDYAKVLNASYTNARYIRITASILPNPSTATPITALTSTDQLANCKIALNETITD